VYGKKQWTIFSWPEAFLRSQQCQLLDKEHLFVCVYSITAAKESLALDKCIRNTSMVLATKKQP
jgi:hypothetical protein